MGGRSSPAITLTRPASSWAKVRPGCVGHDSVPSSPGRRTASTRKGPSPRSNSGCRPSAAKGRSHSASCRARSDESAVRSVTSAVSTWIESAVGEAPPVQLVPQAEEVHLAHPLAVDQGRGPAGLGERP